MMPPIMNGRPTWRARAHVLARRSVTNQTVIVRSAGHVEAVEVLHSLHHEDFRGPGRTLRT